MFDIFLLRICCWLLCQSEHPWLFIWILEGLVLWQIMFNMDTAVRYSLYDMLIGFIMHCLHYYRIFFLNLLPGICWQSITWLIFSVHFPFASSLYLCYWFSAVCCVTLSLCLILGCLLCLIISWFPSSILQKLTD